MFVRFLRSPDGETGGASGSLPANSDGTPVPPGTEPATNPNPNPAGDKAPVVVPPAGSVVPPDKLFERGLNEGRNRALAKLEAAGVEIVKDDKGRPDLDATMAQVQALAQKAANPDGKTAEERAIEAANKRAKEAEDELASFRINAQLQAAIPVGDVHNPFSVEDAYKREFSVSIAKTTGNLTVKRLSNGETHNPTTGNPLTVEETMQEVLLKNLYLLKSSAALLQKRPDLGPGMGGGSGNSSSTIGDALRKAARGG